MGKGKGHQRMTYLKEADNLCRGSTVPGEGPLISDLAQA